jgi:tetratricopeptide (TPR) repeat protein
MSKLIRNRLTLFIFPVLILYLVIVQILLLFTQGDAGIFLAGGLLFVFLFCCVLAFWRLKFPLPFWTFLLFTEPHNARFYNNRASAYLLRGDYEHSLRDYTAGIQLQPEAKILAFLYSGRSALLLCMGRPEDALRDANAALEFPSAKVATDAALHNRGYAYQKLFVYEAALQDYEQIRTSNSLMEPYTCVNRGLILAARGHYWPALWEENTALQKRPHAPIGYANRAIVHLKFGFYRQALEDTNQALARCHPTTRLLTHQGGSHPYAAYVSSLRSLAHCGLYDYPSALEDARQAVKLVSIHGPHFYSLGQVYLAMNELSHAQQAFEHGFEADPREVSNAALFAWVSLCGTFPSSEQAPFLSQAADFYPQSEWGHLCRGMAAWLCGDEALARASLAHARERDVTNPHTYFWLGMLHASAGEDDLAQSAFQQAVWFRLAPVLFMPLRYFEQKRPTFYQSFLSQFCEGKRYASGESGDTT